MQATFRKKENHAFVLYEDDLRKIWNKLTEYDKEVSAKVLFSDEIERTVTTLKELLGFENSKKRKILSIQFYAVSHDRNNSTRVEFENDRMRTITLSSSGDDSVVTKVGDELPEIISGTKPWFSPLSRIDVFSMLMGSFMLLLFFANMMTSSSPESEARTFDESLKVLFGLFSIGLGAFFLNKILTKTRDYVFPVSTFVVGQGKKRYSVQEKVRWGVLVSFFVSLTASIVYGYFI